MRTSTSRSRIFDRQRPECAQQSINWKMAVFAPTPSASDRIATSGECRVQPQQARAVAKILPERLEQRDGVHPIDLLADERRVSKLATRGVARTFLRHAARDVRVGFDRDVRRELARPFVVPAAARGTWKKPSRPLTDFRLRLRLEN